MSETPRTGPIGEPEPIKPLSGDEVEFARRSPKLWERRLVATIYKHKNRATRLLNALARVMHEAENGARLDTIRELAANAIDDDDF